MAIKGKISRRVNAGTFWTVEHLTSPSFLLVVATVCLCVYGLVMVFSASSIELVDAGSSSFHTAVNQAVFMALGALLFVGVVHLGVSRLMRPRWWLVGLALFALLLLILVAVVGTEVNGAKRWLRFGSSTSAPSIQPSEFAKITIVMAFAHYLAAMQQGEKRLGTAIIRLFPLLLLPMGLIFLEKDLGTLIIIAVGLVAILYLAGMRGTHLILLCLLLLGGAALAVFGSGYRNVRFQTWLDPYSDYYGNGWQSIHGLRAIATGGFFGLGLGSSRQKYSYLPEAENDYIFAIIAEELGFFGVMVLLALFVLFGYCGLRIAYEAKGRSLQQSYLAGGLTALIEFQAFLNMAGVTGLLPMTGRPLPFITAGGSSVLSCLIMAGLLYSIARENKQGVREERERRRARTKSMLSVVEGGSPELPEEEPTRIPGPLTPGELTSIPGGRADEGEGRERASRSGSPHTGASRRASRTTRPEEGGQDR